MSLNIVHLLSQTHLTGAEAYAVTLAEGLQARGHRVTLISDTLHLATRAGYIPRPIHSARGLARWREVLWLRRFVKEQNVDVIHAHSRAAVRIAWWATRFSPTALVSTVHGRQHFSWGKRWFDHYGERVLAVCDHLKTQLVRDFRMRASRIMVLGNPVEFPPQRNGPLHRWLMITRWTGPKGERALEMLRDVFPTLLQKHPDLRIDICGARPEKNSRHERILQELATHYAGRLNHIGMIDPLEPRLADYGLILGGGRIAIAAAGAGIPCFAFGEAKQIGLLTSARLSDALASNFGDVLPDQADTALHASEALNELEEFLCAGPSREDLGLVTKKVGHLFDVSVVTEMVIDVYRSARLLKHHPRPIPVLMYHMIVDEPLNTPHRIFVTTETFRLHLETFRRKGMTTLGFKDLLDFKDGRRPLTEFPLRPLILTFDDGYENNLTRAEPLLREYGFKAVLFLLANKGLSANHWDDGASPQIPLLTPDQRRQIANNGIFEIGSHGMGHARLPAMTDEQALRELRESKRLLQEELGTGIHAFAFTYGDIDARSASLARQAGYAYAINTDRGGVFLEESPWSVFRVNVFPEDGAASIAKKSSPWYRWRYFRKRGR